MFSLIMSIISIALIAALSVATILYGVYAYKNNVIYSQATYLLNAANTIAAAAIFAKNDGMSFTGMSTNNIIKLRDAAYLALVPNYESVDFVLDADNSMVKIEDTPTLSLDVCKQLNAHHDNLNFQDVSEVPDVVLADHKYGCYASTGGPDYYTFYYRIDK